VDGAATYWAKLGFVDQTSTLDVTVQKGIRTNYGTDARSGPPPMQNCALFDTECLRAWLDAAVCLYPRVCVAVRVLWRCNRIP
jgi:hypothetical protein